MPKDLRRAALAHAAEALAALGQTRDAAHHLVAALPEHAADESTEGVRFRDEHVLVCHAALPLLVTTLCAASHCSGSGGLSWVIVTVHKLCVTCVCMHLKWHLWCPGRGW